MRVNIYAEELTDRIEIIEKFVEDSGETFYGVRLYLGFPFEHTPGDDDSSAITFWVPWTKASGHDFEHLAAILHAMGARLDIKRVEVE